MRLMPRVFTASRGEGSPRHGVLVAGGQLDELGLGSSVRYEIDPRARLEAAQPVVFLQGMQGRDIVGNFGRMDWAHSSLSGWGSHQSRKIPLAARTQAPTSAS